MITPEEDVEAHALRERGWSITAIANHLGRDRKTIRAYLSGERAPGARKPAPDPLAEFVGYVRARFADDPHIPATTLYDELAGLGFDRSYQSFTRMVRARGLRPVCPKCVTVSGRATIDIAHEPGAETQFDWVELPEAPWLGQGRLAHLFVGVLAYSSTTRAVFAEAEDQAHLIGALDGVVRRLGGVTDRWRFDRMATVVAPGTDRVLASFAQVAKHYAAEVVVCPAYRPNRKGCVEKGCDLIAQRWWRNADAADVTEAQTSLDRFLASTGDARARRLDGRATTVGALASCERLRPPPPVPFPAEVTAEVVVARDATVAFEGNRYGVAPGLIGASVVLRHRLGEPGVRVVSHAGLVVAEHERAVAGAGRTIRTPAQREALEEAVITAAAKAAGRGCRRKTHRPPGDDAKAAAARLRSRGHDGHEREGFAVDLEVYARAVDDAGPCPPAAGKAGDPR